MHPSEINPPLVVLLGDSVFDSRPYLHGMPDMATRLGRLLVHGSVRLAAVSGSRLGDVGRQLAGVPAEATHLIVSLGGNDLLDLARGLTGGSGSIGERLARAGDLLAEFRHRTARACELIAARGIRSALCTIYDPPIGDPVLKQMGGVVLGLVAAVIEEETRARGLETIDLRAVCRVREDFFDMIHPSAHGADKIAAALARWVEKHRS